MIGNRICAIALTGCVRNCGALRWKLDRLRPDHPWPLRKHPVWPHNHRRPNLLCRRILRRLRGAVRRPRLPFRVCPGIWSGRPAPRLWGRAARAISGRRHLDRSRAVRCLLRRLGRLSVLVLTAQLSDALPFGSAAARSRACTPSSNRAPDVPRQGHSAQESHCASNQC